MAKTSIVQLYNEGGNDLALFAFDPEVIKEHDAGPMVEQAIEDAFQKNEFGDLEEVLSEAEEQLAKEGIDRIFASIANTERL